MKQDQILEGNKLIAEFMGAKRVTSKVNKGRYDGVPAPNSNSVLNLRPEMLPYNTSWDWLMPVVEKISDVTGYELIVSSETSYWNRFGDYGPNVEYGGYSYGVIGLFECVVGFIRWYNG